MFVYVCTCIEKCLLFAYQRLQGIGKKIDIDLKIVESLQVLNKLTEISDIFKRVTFSEF